MASIILAAAGTAIGGSIGGSILGVSSAVIGGAVGSLAGAAVDSWLVASMAPTQRMQGQRLDTLQITTSTEGAVIPRVYGRMRIGGNIIWATDFREETETTRHGGGGKGGGGAAAPRSPSTSTSPRSRSRSARVRSPASAASGPTASSMSLDGVTMRVHLGDEDQDADPFIAAKMGAANTPAYRGTAYVVFEELPLERFGNRLPQLSFEVFRPILDGESAESLVRAVTLIPASGEFAYATEVVRREIGETTSAENVNAEAACRRHRGGARPAAGLRAERRVGLAGGRLVRRRSARRPLPHPPRRRGQREVDDAGELAGRRREPRLGASRQPRRSGPPRLRRHAVGQRRRAGDPGAEGPRLPRHLLSVHPDGRARGQRPAGPVLGRRRRRPVSRPIPGAGASPARRRPAMPAASTRPPPPARRSLPSSATPSRPTSTSTTSGSSGTAIRTTGACGG